MPATDLTDWDRFCLLLWKNFFMLWHNRKQWIFLILVPIFICFPIVLFRYHSNATDMPVKQFEPIDTNKAWARMLEILEERKAFIIANNEEFQYSVFVPQMKLGFAPNSYPQVFEIMDTSIKALNSSLELVGSPSCHELLELVAKENYFAGVCVNSLREFRDYSDEDLDEYDEYEEEMNLRPSDINIINYTMLFPSLLRMFYTDFNDLGANWRTNEVYAHFDRRDIRFDESDDGGFVGYVKEGVISLQMAVTEAFLEFAELPVPKIVLKRLAVNKYIKDPMHKLKLTIPLVLLFGFLVPVISFTYIITKEKEGELKMYVRALGISPYLPICAWSIYGFVIFLANSFIVFGTLKFEWNNGYSILTQSNWTCLSLVFVSYSIASTGYCILMSSIFNNAQSAVVLAGIVWMLTFVPYILIEQEYWTYFLCMNTCMAICFELIRYYEMYDKGLQWYNLYETREHELTRRFGTAIITFIITGLLYFFLGILIQVISEDTRTILNKLPFLSRKTVESPTRRQSTYQDPTSTRVTQVEPLYKKQLVVVKNVSKVFDKGEAVKNVDMNLYENDITVLLGHNGAGKTTLLCLIMAIESVTEGRIEIENYNIMQYKAMACANVGGCIGSSLLYEDLSVENQIKFFSRLKGMSWRNASMEVEKYCRQMLLFNKRKTLTRSLTVGLKQQLAVCCAFAGESKIVILDDPTAGMDFSAINLVMKLILNEKKNRTILLSTNTADIADAISDRVSVMAKGELVCSGSIPFLRNMYNYGRRMVITKGDECKTYRVTEFLQKYIPDIQLDAELVRTISYTLHETYSHRIADMLSAMEKELISLNIESYSVDDLTIGEVVLHMGTDYANDADPKRKARILIGETVYSESEYRNFLLPSAVFVPNNGMEFKALFQTRLIFYFRHKWLFISQLLFPVLVTFIMFKYPSSFRKAVMDSYIYTIDNFPQSTVVIAEGSNLSREIADYLYDYKENIYWSHGQHFIKVFYTDDFDQEVVKWEQSQPISFEREVMVGATFQSDYITVYYNSFPLHSAPTSLNTVYSAVARSRNKDIRLFFQMRFWASPLGRHVPLFAQAGGFYNYVIALMLSSLITWSNAVYDMTKSQGANFKHWLHLSGASTSYFWFVTFCFDLARTFILVTAVTISIAIVLNVHVTQTNVLGYYYFSLLIAGICTYSLQYVLAKIIKNTQQCFTTVLLIAVAGIILFVVDIELNVKERFTNEATIKFIFLLHPYYAMGDVLLKIFKVHYYQSMCEKNFIRVLVRMNKNVVPQCAEDIDFTDSEYGIAKNTLAFLFIGLASWVSIIIFENGAGLRNFWVFKIQNDDSECAWEDHTRHHRLDSPQNIEEDNVTREKILLQTMQPQEDSSTLLKIDRLGKFFGVEEALHRFCFVLNNNSICGILGLNGSGKSVLLKIICDELQQSYGQVKIMGHTVKSDKRKIYSHIGYCPESLKCICEYTPRQILKVFAGLAGVPKRKMDSFCESLAKIMGFFDFYDKVLLICSQGIKKRVGAALALTGTSSLILLDEPFSAIDSAGKRILYNIFSRVVKQGKTILFTSLSPIECQGICNKIVIMLSGRLVESGSFRAIHSLYDYGYLLQIRMKHSIQKRFSGTTMLRYSNDSSAARIITLVQMTFANACFRNAEGNLLSFVLPMHQDVGKIFSLIRNNAFSFNIESFGIARAPLQMVYVNIVDRHIYANDI